MLSESSFKSARTVFKRVAVITNYQPRQSDAWLPVLNACARTRGATTVI